MANLSITAADVALVRADEDGLLTGPAGEAINAGQLVRQNTTTGKFEKGNGSSAGEARIAGVALKTVAAGETLSVLQRGLVDVGNALSSLTHDDDVYASDTDGTMADAAGTVTLIVATVVPGWAATTADKLLRVNL